MKDSELKKLNKHLDKMEEKNLKKIEEFERILSLILPKKEP